MIAGYKWPTTTREARAIQEELRGQVVLRDELTPVRRVAGLDVGFPGGGTPLCQDESPLPLERFV